MTPAPGVGAAAGYRRVLQQQDFDRFARLSGDDNPIHCNPVFAASSHFGATVAHGMLLYGCICKALAELIPGPGAVQLEQTLMFPSPTFAGDPISVTLAVEGVSGGILELATEVTKPGPDAAAPLVTATGKARVVPSGVALPQVAAFNPCAEPGDTAFYGLRMGAVASSARVFAAADLEEYGDLVGDRNPIFRDDGAARARGLGVMVGCMSGTSLAMAPAFVLACVCDFVDIDGPLLQKSDRMPGLEYRGGAVSVFGPEVWG